MDIENRNSWASRPDVCRLCLSASGTLDVTASYISDAGVKEVYSEMLQDCYGITLSHLTKWGPSRMVCLLCVDHLREVRAFRDQVLCAEEHFIQYCKNRDDLVKCPLKTEEVDIMPRPAGSSKEYLAPSDVKCPLKTEEVDMPSPAGSSEEYLAPSDDETGPTEHIEKVDAVTIKIEKENIVKTKKHKAVKPKCTKKGADEDRCYDSDSPISRLLIKESSKERLGGDEELMKIQNCDGEVSGPFQAVANNGMKQVSERKRVMLTCDAVLRDTTACPFRHHKSWFQCFFCLKEFMEIKQLRDHTLQTHSDVDSELKKIKRYPRSLQIEISNLECRNCRLGLADVVEMRRHLDEVHNKIIYKECIADYKVNASPYSCHICKQEFHVFRTLTTHLNEHYANCICDVCGKSFLNSKRLKVHKRTHEAGNFPCSECGKVLKTKTSKANHMESAHSNRQLKCQICFKPMKHYNDRIKHMSEAHNITHKFQCPICGREYNIKHYLATHIRQTHGHKNKKCSECGMAFITNHGLKKHMLKHSGEKPFSCSVCSKSYARSYTLREHMRLHKADRRFLCPD